MDGQKSFNKIKEIIPKLPYMKAVLCWGELTDKTALKNQKGEEVKVYTWDELITLGATISEEVLDKRTSDQKPTQCCCLVFTSGTTGNPKAVMLSHDACIWTAQCVVTVGMETVGRRAEQERVISYLPLSHVAGKPPCSSYCAYCCCYRCVS